MIRFCAVLFWATLAAGALPGQSSNPLLGNVYGSPPEVKGGPIVRLPDGKPDLQGTWLQRTKGGASAMVSIETQGRRPGIIVDPPDGRIPYQPWAREKQADLQ